MDEVALVAYEQRTVEEMVTSAWERIGGDDMGLNSRQGHSVDEVTARLNVMKTTPEEIQPTELRRLYDKVCYITGKGIKEDRDHFVIEYKAADKLTPEIVLEGLHDVELETIRRRIKASTDKVLRRTEVAEEALATVIAQTYDNMIDQGLCYRYATWRKAFVFLFIHPDHPQTLFYEKVFLNETPRETLTDIHHKIRLTSVGLVSSFAQLASGKLPMPQGWRNKARSELPIWGVSDDEILAEFRHPPTEPEERMSPEFPKPESDGEPKESSMQTRNMKRGEKRQASCETGCKSWAQTV